MDEVEYLDIVDEDDRVIGRDTRQRVHQEYKIHRGVHVFVVSNDRKILVQRRSSTRDYYPGYLDVSVGAQVRSGESYVDAARRELNEELGCEHDSITEVAAYDAFSSRQREKRKIFVHYCDGPFAPDPGEVASIDFYTASEISDLMGEDDFTQGFVRSFEILQSSAAAVGDPPVAP